MGLKIDYEVFAVTMNVGVRVKLGGTSFFRINKFYFFRYFPLSNGLAHLVTFLQFVHQFQIIEFVQYRKKGIRFNILE